MRPPLSYLARLRREDGSPSPLLWKFLEEEIDEADILKQVVYGKKPVYSLFMEDSKEGKSVKIFDILQKTVIPKGLLGCSKEGGLLDYSKINDDVIHQVDVEFWDNVAERAKKGHRQKPALYLDGFGAMSLFPDKEEGNVNNLKTFLQNSIIEQSIDTRSSLFLGQFNTCFSWHIDPKDVGTFNLMHGGFPKRWYIIPPNDHKQGKKSNLTRFQEYMRKTYSNPQKNAFGRNPECPGALYHKDFLLPPNELSQNGITVKEAVQFPGEVMLLFHKTPHSGYNTGVNINEFVNVAGPSFLDWCDHYSGCQCGMAPPTKLPNLITPIKKLCYPGISDRELEHLETQDPMLKFNKE